MAHARPFADSTDANRLNVHAHDQRGHGSSPIEAGDVFKVRSVNPPLDDDGLFLASPALAGTNLLIRGARKLHCLREGAGK